MDIANWQLWIGEESCGLVDLNHFAICIEKFALCNSSTVPVRGNVAQSL
ncbi:hypothetical protein RESH_01383 [Rhodopirellula europaea SH398]|uniref:Uncharacterized protein n=1 Tax=Rhodopirellula europaea SH398 TaxID=1263868 RepID=M5S8K3_9BACT|nr:hypothetical protein RESH_01383 [Rhodopirellula europaea SH398]